MTLPILRVLVLAAAMAALASAASCAGATGCESCADSGGDMTDASVFTGSLPMTDANDMCLLDGSADYELSCPTGQTCRPNSLAIGMHPTVANPSNVLTARCEDGAQLRPDVDIDLYGSNSRLVLDPGSHFEPWSNRRSIYINGGAQVTSYDDGASVWHKWNVHLSDAGSKWTVVDAPSTGATQVWTSGGLQVTNDAMFEVDGDISITVNEQPRSISTGGEIYLHDGSHALCYYVPNFYAGGVFRGSDGNFDGDLCSGTTARLRCEGGTVYLHNYNFINSGVFDMDTGSCTIYWSGANTVAIQYNSGGINNWNFADDTVVLLLDTNPSSGNIRGDMDFNSNDWTFGRNVRFEVNYPTPSANHLRFDGRNTDFPDIFIGANSVLRFGKRLHFVNRHDVIAESGVEIEIKSAATTSRSLIEDCRFSGSFTWSCTGDPHPFRIDSNTDLFISTDHRQIPVAELNPQNFVSPTTWTFDGFDDLHSQSGSEINLFIAGDNAGEFSFIDASGCDIITIKAGTTINVYWKFSNTFPQAARKTRSIVVLLGPETPDSVVLEPGVILNLGLGDFDDTMTAMPTLTVIGGHTLTLSLFGLDSSSPCDGFCDGPNRCKVYPCVDGPSPSCQAEQDLICDDGDPNTKDTCDPAIEFDDTCVYSKDEATTEPLLGDFTTAMLYAGVALIGVTAIGVAIVAMRSRKDNAEVLEAAKKILESAKAEKESDAGGYGAGGYGGGSDKGSLHKPGFGDDTYSVGSEMASDRSYGRMTQASMMSGPSQPPVDMQSSISAATLASGTSRASGATAASSLTLERPRGRSGSRRGRGAGRRPSANGARKQRSNTAPARRRG